MARKCLVVLSLVAGLLLGASPLLAQQAAPPVKQADARSLVPEGAVLYVEVNDLAETWEAVKAGPLYQELLETEGGKRLQVLAAAVQTQFQVNVGATLEELITELLGERIILAAWPHDQRQEGGTADVLLVQVIDGARAADVLSAIRQSEVTQGKVEGYEEVTYRGHTIYRKVPAAPGTHAYSVLCDNVAVFGDTLAALELLIDRVEETPATSILNNERFAAARASLPAGHLVMAFVDFEKALAEAALDEERLAAGKPPVARYLVKHVLPLIRSLRHAAAGLYLTSSGAEVQLNVTRDPSVLTDEVRAILSQENATPAALAYAGEDTVLFASLPRITAQMRLVAQAVEQLLPPLPEPPAGTTEAQPVRPLDLILGRSFTREVLPGIGPEISLMVEANSADVPLDEGAQGAELLAAQLTAALFVQLSDDLQPDVERLVDTGLGVLLTVAREGFRLSQARIGDLSAYVVQPRKAQPPSLNQLLQPTIAFADGFLVLCTHPRALERALATRAARYAGYESRFLTTEEPGTLAGHIVALADLKRMFQVLESSQPFIVSLRAQRSGRPEAEVARNVANALEFIRPLAGQLTLTVQHTPAETNANLNLRTATPLLQ